MGQNVILTALLQGLLKFHLSGFWFQFFTINLKAVKLISTKRIKNHNHSTGKKLFSLIIIVHYFFNKTKNNY